MQERIHQLEKLKRILQFYEKELEMHKSRVAAQSALVERARNEAYAIQREIVRSRELIDNSGPSIANRELGTHCLAQAQTELHNKQLQWNEAAMELESRKVELRKQLRKIESMEKLIDRKAVSLQYEVNRREQTLADERYLSTDFEGTKS